MDRKNKKCRCSAGLAVSSERYCYKDDREGELSLQPGKRSRAWAVRFPSRGLCEC